MSKPKSSKPKSQFEKPAQVSESQEKISSILDEAASESNGSPVHTFDLDSNLESAVKVLNEDRAEARDSQDHDQHPKFDKFKKGNK